MCICIYVYIYTHTYRGIGIIVKWQKGQQYILHLYLNQVIFKLSSHRGEKMNVLVVYLIFIVGF